MVLRFVFQQTVSAAMSWSTQKEMVRVGVLQMQIHMDPHYKIQDAKFGVELCWRFLCDFVKIKLKTKTYKISTCLFHSL